MEIHLVDGTYELFRGFYGPPGAASLAGREIGASRALLRSLLSLLTRGGETYIAVAFDHVVESFRNELFDGYKTGEGIDEELLSQFPLAEEVVRALGIVTWPMIEFEADDALATAAARYSADPRVDRVVICTPDKDLAQCVRSERVVCLDRRKEVLRDEAGVLEKFGVLPASIPDWLALVGDAADGIPGIAGWGAKSSALVLREYGHIENIPEDPDAWAIKVRGAARLSAALEAARNDAYLYRKLATLRIDVPLAESVDELAWKGADRALLEPMLLDFRIPEMLERVPSWRRD